MGTNRGVLDPQAPPGSLSDLDVQQLRQDFPILKEKIYGKPLVYLDNAATSQKPRAVIDATARFYSSENSNVHRGVLIKLANGGTVGALHIIGIDLQAPAGDLCR